MAFLAEDGTGLALANSFSTVAFADAYFTERGIAEWTGSQAIKEQALVKASDYIEKRFAGLWRGVKMTRAQALAWPRAGAFDDDGYALYDPNAVDLPTKLKEATAEYALRSLLAPLLPDPEDGGNAPIIRKMEKVGPLEEDTEWARPTTLTHAYPAADRLLRSLTVQAGCIR